MNKVILMGRLTKDPEVRYSKGNEPLAVANYSLAVNRRFKRDGDADADFIDCVAFGKAGEFAEKYFRKGQMVSVVGRLQVRSYDDKDGVKKWSTDVIIEEQHFAESKASFESNKKNQSNDFSEPSYKKNEASSKDSSSNDGFESIDSDDEDDDDLPF